MKKTLFFFFFLQLVLISSIGYSQIAVGVANAHPSAALEIKSVSKGFAIPRMTTSDRIAISHPAQGLQVYDTTTKSFWYYNGNDWTDTNQDASAVQKGLVQLSNDLSGTADMPKVSIGAVTSSKIKDGTVQNGDLSTETGGVYKGSGALASNTVIDAGSNTLQITSNAAKAFSVGQQVLVVNAATHSVAIGTGNPESMAVLDVSSATKGLLPPRMTTAQRNLITGPPIGLMIYNTTVNCIEVYNGTIWSSNCRSNTLVGDIKYDLRTADHNGWVILDGRLKTSLSSAQQSKLASLGITGSYLPDSRNYRLRGAGASAWGITYSSAVKGGRISLVQSDLPADKIPYSFFYTPGGTISSTYSGGNSMNTWDSTHTHTVNGVSGRDIFPSNNLSFSDRSNLDTKDSATDVNTHNHTFVMPDISSTFVGSAQTMSIGVTINGTGSQSAYHFPYLALHTFMYLGN